MQNAKYAGGAVRLKPPDVQISVQNFGLLQKVDRLRKPANRTLSIRHCFFLAIYCKFVV